MNQLENYLMGKEADVSGTNLMPYGAKPKSSWDPSPIKTIPKTGEALEQAAPVSGTQYEKAPQAKDFKLHVDTAGKEPPKKVEVKEAQHYAMPSCSRYPLDTQVHVKVAAAYFEENSKLMTPEQRHEYCQNLCKRASALGIQVSPNIRKYGSDTYARPAEFVAALDSRVGVVKEAELQSVLTELKSYRAVMPPEDFAVALSQFDKVASIEHLYGQEVADPYYTTFGEKIAEEDEDGSILVGNDYVPYQDLRTFARTNAGLLCNVFGEDFVKEFRKDPVGITKSLPNDQKKIVIRMVSSMLTDPTPT